jgi:quinol monooxygenase YgiN
MNAVLELRQYTLHPGQRDTLIDLFEREFVETQEAVGIRLLGLFRDLDDPDRFVWLRGFTDMATRAEALNAFYTGPAWLAHRDAANATMIDSDNVLLLRPTSEFASAGGAIVIATTYSLPRSIDAARFMEFFAREIQPILVDAGGTVLLTCVSEHASNTFPRLPVREGENVFVWLAGFDALETFSRCRGELQSTLQLLAGTELPVEAEQTLRLAPI